MKRALKWLLPALAAFETALVWSGVLDLGDAVLIVAGIEVLLLLTGIGEVVLVFRHYRRGRASGLDPWAAIEDGLALILPRPAAKLAVSEPRMFVCLARWALGRANRGENEFGYHKRSTIGMLVLMVWLTAPVELLVYEILVPWAWLRWVLLILGFYAAFWFLGFYASLVALPHRLEAVGVRLRYGVFTETFIPYSEVEGVERASRRPPKGGEGLQATEEAVYLAVTGKTNLTLKLRVPRTVMGVFRSTGSVATVHLSADDPGRLTRELERRVGEAAGATPAAAASAG